MRRGTPRVDSAAGSTRHPCDLQNVGTPREGMAGRVRLGDIVVRQYRGRGEASTEALCLEHTGADTTGHLAVFTGRTRCHTHRNNSQETRFIFS